MGGAVSTGKDNDDLADKLAEGNYIKSRLVEMLFRAVDRGHYFLPDHMEQAYRDTAWRSGNIHMSAPCIYSEVLEALELRPGLSFLNLGSGTGYLSTMVGLALGPYAINHGIELHPDVVNYAISRLNAFVQSAECYDEFDDLCLPIFVVGNCLLCSTHQRYDRIYCGAACPENQLGKLKSLLKPGGILVVPVSDRLVQFRLEEDGFTWTTKDRMPVSFASLITPKSNDLTNEMPEGNHSSEDSEDSTFEPPQLGANTITPAVRDRIPVLPDFFPPSLQQACRFVIRRHIRNLIIKNYPELLQRRLFDREAYKKKHEEREQASNNGEESGEGDSNPPERQRPRRRRTRYLSIGNNFGVVIISENGSSSEDDESEEVETPAREPEEMANGTEQPTKTQPAAAENQEATGIAQATGGNAEGDAARARPQMPHLLRFLLEARRLTQNREIRVDPQAAQELAQQERHPLEGEEEEEASANSRRRRRVSSNASTTTSEEVKKPKENSGSSRGSTSENVDQDQPKVESTGRRLSRHLHEIVHELQLPQSLEAFLLHYRQAPPKLPSCPTKEEAESKVDDHLVLVR